MYYDHRKKYQEVPNLQECCGIRGRVAGIEKASKRSSEAS